MTTHEPPSQTLPAGTRLEEFTIDHVLGSGGFGVTYLATDTSLGRKVVIKENLPAQFCFRDPGSLTVAPRHTAGEDAENFAWSLRNFSREASILASLDHPGIVRVLRSFEAFGTAFFVMPFVEGKPFDRVIEARWQSGGMFSETELRGLLWYSLDALDHLHARQIFHRDIKPANILITAEGVPVLIDFGSARQRLSEISMTVVESAGYTPFEQLQSHGDIGPWTDLYALGATLVKALTHAALPKAADRVIRDPWSGLTGDPALQAHYSAAFLQAVEKAVAVAPAERWQSGRDWLQGMDGGGEAAVVSGKPKGAATKLIFASPPPAPPHAAEAQAAGTVANRVPVARAGLTHAQPVHPVAKPRSGAAKVMVLGVLALGVAAGVWVVRFGGEDQGADAVATTDQAALAAERRKVSDAEERAMRVQAELELAAEKTRTAEEKVAAAARHAARQQTENARMSDGSVTGGGSGEVTPRPTVPPAQQTSQPSANSEIRAALAAFARGTIEEAKDCVSQLEAVEKKHPSNADAPQIKVVVLEVFRAEASLQAAIRALPKAKEEADNQLRSARISRRPSPLTGRVNWEDTQRHQANAVRIVKEANAAVENGFTRLGNSLQQAKQATSGRFGDSIETTWDMIAKRNHGSSQSITLE